MRSLFLVVSALFLSSNIALADYTLRNVYKFENVDMVTNHDGSNVMNATVTGVSSDSNGNTTTIKCLVNVANKVISGHCQGTDQDGDIEYTTVSRDMAGGNNQGTFVRTGGTGKYANSSATCVYTVELTDFKIGVGYLTAICKE
mgnify:FL=1